MASRGASAASVLAVVLAALVVCSSVLPRALATDPTQLQDFCVADRLSAVFVNGFVCKNPKQVTANDFFLRGFNIPGNTAANAQGFAVTSATVNELAGLNTLGISLVRIDYAPNGGQNPPHTHPRATEILTVIQGQLLVGFVTSNQAGGGNLLFTKQLAVGDVFVFPQGLIHFQVNNGAVPAVAIAALSSQNPGVITIANAVFGSTPPILDVVLAKAFMVDKEQVDWIQAKFAAPPAAGGGGVSNGTAGGGFGGGGGAGGGFPGGGVP
uniref:Germin-like protein n=1 Tax=Leersia perrieri TaxID=77586 RepID=A0A0D9W9I9_9ORYZ